MNLKFRNVLTSNLLGPGPRLMKMYLPGRGLTKVEKHCSKTTQSLVTKQSQCGTYFSNTNPRSNQCTKFSLAFRDPRRRFCEMLSLYRGTNVAVLLSFFSDNSRPSISCSSRARGFPWTSPIWRPFLPVLSVFFYLLVLLQSGFRKRVFFVLVETSGCFGRNILRHVFTLAICKTHIH